MALGLLAKFALNDSGNPAEATGIGVLPIVSASMAMKLSGMTPLRPGASARHRVTALTMLSS